MNKPAIKNGKTNATISYLTIIGTIIALVLNNSEKNSFVSFHVRQMVGLNILFFLNEWIIDKYFGFLAWSIIGCGIFILWIIGFMGVIKGEQHEVPIFGKHFQDWFKTF